MLTKSQNFAWSEVGGSLQDYTSASSETPGEPKEQTKLDKAMKAPIDMDKIRKAGM